MVETITPVVHGGNRNRWMVSVLVHVAGAAAAAAVFGSLLAGAGALLGAPWGVPGVALVAASAGVYGTRELGVPVPVPQLRRQVPDWWRTFFPPHVAAFLYGVGLGPGFLTYLGHGTLVVVSVAAAASGRPLVGAALLAPFGLARGLGPVVALGVRSPSDGAALVDRLGRSASRGRWRKANAVALGAVLVAALAWIRTLDGPSDIGALASAALTLTFGAAAIAKIAHRQTWRGALAAYRLPPGIVGPVAICVLVLELAIAVMPVLGLSSTSGVVALSALGVFSAAIVVGRLRAGRRLGCGCFGSSTTRDYRLLLVRNLALAAVAIVAWRAGDDTPVLRSLASPGGTELVPVVLVVAGLTLATWVGTAAFAASGRRYGR
jgi:Methylamine utilisation protein MauE